VVELGAEAAQQVRELAEHFEARGRPEAAFNLFAAVRQAKARIEREPLGGLPAPRPYPALAREGERWVKEGRYWLSYSLAVPPIILAVFYDQADLPRRAR
jgi:plasmid stabilization system protein ParE